MIKILKKPLMIIAFVLALAISFVAIEPSNAENDSSLKIELKCNMPNGVPDYVKIMSKPRITLELFGKEKNGGQLIGIQNYDVERQKNEIVIQLDSETRQLYDEFVVRQDFSDRNSQTSSPINTNWVLEKEKTVSFGKQNVFNNNYTDKHTGKISVTKLLKNNYGRDSIPVVMNVAGNSRNESSATVADKSGKPLEFTFQLLYFPEQYSLPKPVPGVETIKIKAGETKSFENLYPGYYRFVEMERHGFIPEPGNYGEIPLKNDVKKSTVVNFNGHADGLNYREFKINKIWQDGENYPSTVLRLMRKSASMRNAEEIGRFSTEKGKKEDYHIFRANYSYENREYMPTMLGFDEVTSDVRDSSDDKKVTKYPNYFPKFDEKGYEYRYFVDEPSIPNGYEAKIESENVEVCRELYDPTPVSMDMEARDRNPRVDKICFVNGINFKVTNKKKTTPEKPKKPENPKKPEKPKQPENPSNPQRPRTPSNPPVDRVPGKDRVETSVNVSKKYYSSAKTVIVVRKDLFPDSMTATVLSKLLNAPILLTDVDKLEDIVKDEIKRLGAKEIIIVGGPNSVSENVKKELEYFDSEVERISGSDRYETSDKVARRVVGITGNLNKAVIASGEVFPDALAISPFAASKGYPILLVKKDSISDKVKVAFKDLEINRVYLIGGYNTISKSTEMMLPHVHERIAGVDRYETSVLIAKSKFGDSSRAFLVSGEVFADALVVGPVAGKYNEPILLTTRNNAPTVVSDYVKKSKIRNIIAIGGEKYVPNSVINSLKK
ncbi:cell wall-binding repeat-containing protein [Peptostreptococcus porci]|uniref:cell wall-binding repeat-containing protein n=1 Tax=Peptostreptococcus porci TaxID=2652282 RepID=UPI0023F47ADD|nr:cell wall-binding repeat-containing protein [Peptostreptococcus porci]MDD7182313.1 cell wall-binding repeat-containing protein [Peptostreptococcus porci]